MAEEKAKSIKRFGPRYGRTIKKRFGKLEVEQRKLHKCPFCNQIKVKRLSRGIWQCRKCDSKFTGKAYTLAKIKKSAVVSEETGLKEADIAALEAEYLEEQNEKKQAEKESEKNTLTETSEETDDESREEDSEEDDSEEENKDEGNSDENVSEDDNQEENSDEDVSEDDNQEEETKE